MQAFDVKQLLAQDEAEGARHRYHEFLRVPSLSVGLYRLPAGAEDTQKPHTEDELYYVVSGRGSIRVADERRPVEAGTMVFVRAKVEHRFVQITEDLVLLVFFAPAEYSRRVESSDDEG